MLPGQRGEVAAWHTATGDKPMPHLWGAQHLWLPLVSHIVV